MRSWGQRAGSRAVAAALLLALSATGCDSGGGGVSVTASASDRQPSTSSTPAVDAHGDVIRVGPMYMPRAAHTATALDDGEVLIAGGFGTDDGDGSSAELFDPKTNRFTPTGSMSVGRQSHTATLLADGRVLIAGGYDPNGDRLAAAELYDPETGTFGPTGPMLAGRADQTATLLQDGRLVIVGGTGPGYSFLSTAELYDPRTGTFTATGSMSVPRESATATLLQDGRVLIAGGHAGRHESITIYESAEIFDPATGTISPTGNMTIARHKHDAVLLSDGTVLIVGGSDARDDLGLYDSAEIFDPAIDSFSPAGRLVEARYKMRGTTVLLGDGRALVCCGAAQPEAFDPATRTFQVIPGSMGAGPLFAAAARVGKREVLVTGGYSLSGPATTDAWIVRA